MLRCGGSAPANAHRLGGNAAPPAIVSIFLGDELTAILRSIIDGTAYVDITKKKLEIGVDTLPEVPQATTARLYKHIVLKDSRKMGEPLGRVVFTRKAMSDERRRQQIAAMVQGYNRACDSLNQYGLKNYADIVATCCHADAKTLQALPKMTYPHIAVPKWEKKTAKPKK